MANGGSWFSNLFHLEPSRSASWGKRIFRRRGKWTMWVVVSGVIAWLLVILPGSIPQAGTFVVFGPQDYVRAPGKPIPTITPFSIQNPSNTYTLLIDNGGAQGQYPAVSSATIVLNGAEIVGPNAFNQNVSRLEVPVVLLAENTLTVQVRSKPGSGFTLQILGLNATPQAHAGPDQTVAVNGTVQLDGSGSIDTDGDQLTFGWTLITTPLGSATTLANPTSVMPNFIADVAGTYVAQLIVNDGTADSAPDTVTISTENSLPVANAGPDQTVLVTETVTLDGSGSVDVDGDALTFEWIFLQVPGGSTATLSDSTGVMPTFVADQAGSYIAQLTVHDSSGSSAPDSVVVITVNSPPVADAGPDQTVFVTQPVLLDGTASNDVDGDPLTFAWALLSVPAGSAATLSDATAVQPTFTVDQPGIYVAQLIVNDGTADSAPDTVMISTQNSRPVAEAGVDQEIPVASSVQLDGSGSQDVDGDPLTFAWALLSVPAGSAAMLSDPSGVTTTFVADEPGMYVVQLIVNDGLLDSDPTTVTIVTENTRPVANAGPDQNVEVNTTVQLDGGGSTDPDGDALTYQWAFTAIPTDSGAVLSDPPAMAPTFVADHAGTYVVQLIVNDGALDSATDTVTITAGDGTGNEAPLVTLKATPSAGTAPLQLNFDATVTEPDGDTTSINWDFGDGTMRNQGANQETHTYQNPGIYTAIATVSDGQAEGSDETTVFVAHGSAIMSIGSAGGALVLNRFSLTVPPNQLPGPLTLAVFELPSQIADVANDLDPSRFIPLGPAYHLAAPSIMNGPVTLSLNYDSSEIPLGFAASNLGIIIRSEVVPDLLDPNASPPVVPSPNLLFIPLPGTVDQLAHRVSLEIAGGGTYQMVAQAQAPVVFGNASRSVGPILAMPPPLSPMRTSQAEPAIWQVEKHPPLRLVQATIPCEEPAGHFEVVVHDGSLPILETPVNYASRICAQLARSEFVLVDLKEFRGPWAIKMKVKVVARKMPEGSSPCQVDPRVPFVITCDPVLVASNVGTQFEPEITAHEYFHIIQHSNSNIDSAGNFNRWFLEGTAQWAMDEVYDSIRGYLPLDNGRRLISPLNKPIGRYDKDAYRPIIFWKWLEHTAPGTIRDMLLAHCLQTNWTSSSCDRRVVNSNSVNFTDALRDIAGIRMDYIDFLTAVLFYKDFDTDENKDLEVWDPFVGYGPLPPPYDLPHFFRNDESINNKLGSQGTDNGDGISNKKVIAFDVDQHLATDVQLITNDAAPNGLSGTLHLKFLGKPENNSLEAAVISQESKNEQFVSDLTVDHEVMVGFGENSKAIIVLGDGEIAVPADPITSSIAQMEAWVEPCGAPITNVTNVVPANDLQAAIDAANPGDTLRLAPGNYTIGAIGPSGVIADLTIEKDLTIQGSGLGKTTLTFLQSTLFNGFRVGPNSNDRLNNVTIRDLNIVQENIFGGMLVNNTKKLSLCNVDYLLVRDPSDSSGSGSSEVVRYLVRASGVPHGIFEAHGFTAQCDFCNPILRPAGIGVYLLGSPLPLPEQGGNIGITAIVRNSNINGWKIGIAIDDEDAAASFTRNIDVDCQSVIGNQENVIKENILGEDPNTGFKIIERVELCPAPPSP